MSKERYSDAEWVEPNAAKVDFNLSSVDSNAFSLIAGWSKAARKQGWSYEAIEKVKEECQSGDYDHLLQTLIKYTK